MEKVQFQQEQMLAELKDLSQKGLFTKKEIKQIMKKRTAFETSLVRRVAKKADFLRYATYEMSLEALRKKRVERLNLPPSPPSISDYALVRRQFYIFERALKKFKADVGLWIQYIQVAKREGARALVGRITARALQLHPNTPALYIIAASHELEHLSPSAARTLLQRGIRLNGESVDLWREYVKMELGFVEGLRRRWDLLGISLKGKEKERERAPDQDQDAGAPEPMQIDDEEIEGDAARQAVLDGAIVKSVISSAAKALPKLDLFVSLQHLIRTYPSPQSLRESLLEHLYAQLQIALPTDPDAVRLHATRALADSPHGAQLIDALRSANAELLATARETPGVCDAYAAFAEEWCAKDIDANLKTYLLASLHALIRDLAPAPASLRAAHLRMLRAHGAWPHEKVLRAARKYTRVDADAGVWLARLAVERDAGRAGFEGAWAEARGACVAEDVWAAGLEGVEGAERVALLESLLKESMRDAELARVHEALLLRYVASVPGITPATVRHIARTFLPTARVWEAVFNASSDTDVLSMAYAEWREKEAVEAALAWARWLLRAGRGREAMEVILRARGLARDEERVVLEARWAEIVKEEEKDVADDSGEEE